MKKKNGKAKPRPIAGNFKLERRRSRIHRWGVYAAESIPARRRVIEYTGQIIDAREMERRSGKSLLYLFAVSKNKIIDGAVNSSGAEFINHSCDGNMRSASVKGRIFLTSLRRIEAGEELTYDYNIDEEFEVPCECGATNCRGKLGNSSAE